MADEFRLVKLHKRTTKEFVDYCLKREKEGISPTMAEIHGDEFADGYVWAMNMVALNIRMNEEGYEPLVIMEKEKGE